MPSVGLELVYAGDIQGVGFRPHVYRIAVRHGLVGWVRNQGGSVVVRVEGAESSLTKFLSEVETLTPAANPPRLIAHRRLPLQGFDAFIIQSSKIQGQQVAKLPLDRDWCEDCARDYLDASNRRGGYVFINCAQCGPRYTIIESLPYDRDKTTMEGFALCASCSSEYNNPGDRRFHAEAISCQDCGPRLWFDEETTQHSSEAINSAANVILEGFILAMKGVGGYHLICDATNSLVVQLLRERKNRPTRPFAVLFPEQGSDDLDGIRQAVHLSPVAANSLRSPMRPIVLLPKLTQHCVSECVAPNVPDFGVFLPPTPLHRELARRVNRPMIATSANVTGEPIEHEPKSAVVRLASFADHFLHHNRPIAHTVDDSIQREIAAKPRWLRISRGAAPRSWKLPKALNRPTIALGGHLKSTVTLAWGDCAVASPHIGDMDSARTRALFATTIESMQTLHGVTATRWVGDAHPDYASRRWAERSGFEVETILHHHAHASALALDADCWNDLLVFTWDGAGLGTKNQLWGGEAFYGGPGNWRRVAHFKPFYLVGGDSVGREPWRSAASLCLQTRTAWSPISYLDPKNLVANAWEAELYRQYTTSAGRLFDAAASLILNCHKTSYEGESGLRLEALAQNQGTDGPQFLIERNSEGCWEINWEPWVSYLIDSTKSMEERASALHSGFAKAIADVTRLILKECRVDLVGLTGGVFQNRVLTEQALEQLSLVGIPTFLPTNIPSNDGGISLGQIVEAAHR